MSQHPLNRVRSARLLGSALLMLSLLSGFSISSVEAASAYAINLQSSQKRLKKPSQVKDYEGYQLYTVRFKSKKDGKIWNRLRLGFFPSLAAARRALNDIKAQYPSAWVAKASSKEQRLAAKQNKRKVAKKPSRKKSTRSQKANGSKVKLSVAESQRIMKAARQAMTGKKYRRAISLLTHLHQNGHSSQQKDSQELLGLAYERKGQLAHAKAEYENYLRQYPKGKETQRVQQRLSGLLTAQVQPREKLRGSAKQRQDRKPKWRYFTNLSQYYSTANRNTTSNGSSTSEQTQSDLNTYISVSADRRGGRFEVSTDMNLDSRYEFPTDSLDTARDRTRLRSLYAEVVDKDTQLSGRIGRQRLNKYGVLGRFDGLLSGYSITQKIRTNAVIGFPVNTSDYAQINTDNPFYGASVEYGPYRENWDFTGYFIEQRFDTLVDRRAIGGEARYLDQKRSLFTLLDYDVFHSALNTVLVLGNWTLENKGRAYLSYSQLKSPTLLTQNAIGSTDLTGNQLLTLSALQQNFSDDQIYQLAKDKTEESKNLTLGWARPINKKYQYDTSLNVASLTGSSGQDISYNLQLIANGLLKKGDSGIVGLRVQNSDSSNVIYLSGNMRYPYDKWRFNPRLVVQKRDNKSLNSNSVVLTPSVRVDYRFKRDISFESELRMDITSDTDNAGGTTDTNEFYINLGYRWDFAN
ncbi:MAG: SPOR domain-containing protein [Gammaproteobacteria bacterium]|nr:SPOR domain-containing protein [Gammaproteobacteria bacterium]